MKNRVFLGLFVCFITLNLFAHDEYFLEIINNKNNTLTIIGDDDHKEGIAGALIKIESLVTGDLLFKERLPVSSKLIIQIPKEPYQIVLDAGPGHIIVKDGVAPIEGFLKELKVSDIDTKLSKEEDLNEDWDLTTIFFFTLCLILFCLVIYFSNRNTNKILEQLK